MFCQICPRCYLTVEVKCTYELEYYKRCENCVNESSTRNMICCITSCQTCSTIVLPPSDYISHKYNLVHCEIHKQEVRTVLLLDIVQHKNIQLLITAVIYFNYLTIKFNCLLT